MVKREDPLCDYRESNLRQRTCMSLHRNNCDPWCLKCTHRMDHKHGKHAPGGRHGPDADCPLCPRGAAVEATRS